MTTTQRKQRLNTILSAHRDQLLAEIAETLRRARDDSRDVAAGDMFDRVELVQEEDVAFALLGMKNETVRRIEDALACLDAGNFGVCADCDQEIAESRLEAVPFATRCRDCQASVERHDHSPARFESAFFESGV